MDMLQSPHALQRDPILEPEDAVLTILPDSGHEDAIDKILDDAPALRSQVSFDRFRLDSGARPDDEMGHVRGESVRPVVDEDPVVCGVFEGHR